MATATRPLPGVITDFVAEIEHVVATTDDRRHTIERLYRSFAALLHDPTWLHPDHRTPVPGKFAQYAI
jgi:hypothetical protein